MEELHTACELILEHLVNPRSKRLSFRELVEAASEQGYLDWPRADVIVPAVDPKSLLLELKDFRKNARHRADRTFEPWLKDNWERIAMVLERLAATVSET